MALTTVSEQIREDSANLYEEMISGKNKSGQNLSVMVHSTISESDLLKALGDEYMRMILLSIIDEPKSVIEISREQHIPISSAYRKIHWLEKAGLINVKGFIITSEGKKYHMYQSRIKSMHISLAANSFRIEFTSNNGNKFNPSQEKEIQID